MTALDMTDAARGGMGRLIGVGVGPGAPDLLTLRAARLIVGPPRKSGQDDLLLP